MSERLRRAGISSLLPWNFQGLFRSIPREGVDRDRDLGRPVEAASSCRPAAVRRKTDRFHGSELGARAPLGEAKLVGLLEVEPELGRGPESAGETEGRVCGHGTLLVEDPRHSVGRDVKRVGESLGYDHTSFIPTPAGVAVGWHAEL
jgi:hypothetical protein